MNSVKNTTAAAASITRNQTEQKGLDIWFNKVAEKFEETRFGWMALIITLQSCLGSIACMYILQNNATDVQLMLCAAITMACNSIFIAQGPAKWCLTSFFISVLVNAVLIFINL